jgi:hypothetical protein
MRSIAWIPEPLDEMLEPSPRSVHGWAIRAGWSPAQAGNLAAWFAGIRIVDGEDEPLSAWSLRTIEHCLFLRWLVDTGRLEPPAK